VAKSDFFDKAEQARLAAAMQGGVPILGRPKADWICPECGYEPPMIPMAVGPDGGQMLIPHSIVTALPGETEPVFLCPHCDVRVRRQTVPHLIRRGQQPPASVDGPAPEPEERLS